MHGSDVNGNFYSNEVKSVGKQVFGTPAVTGSVLYTAKL